MKSKVAVLRTSPETVVEDYGRLMDLAGYREALPFDQQTCLRINISWHVYMPACSTTPWQMHGVIRKMKQDGYDVSRDLIAAQNDTVVVSCRVGAVNNHLQPVLEHYGVPIQYLSERAPNGCVTSPSRRCRGARPGVRQAGNPDPRLLLGKNVSHMPTVKTHIFTGTTGSMKNAFGGLLNLNRHWTHSVIHETLVDLLRIQQEIYPGIFAVMDGTIAGEGPGPRAMRPHVKNVILASSDCVAIDAIAAKLMGFDPMKDLKFIRLAHENGLGVGNERDRAPGDDVSSVNFGFRGSLNENTLASWGQKLIYRGPLWPLENILLRSPIVPWSYLASRAYHDGYWYPVQEAARPGDREDRLGWAVPELCGMARWRTRASR